MQACNSIALFFETNEEHIKVNSHTKFAVNMMNIQEAIETSPLSNDSGKFT